MLQNRIYRGEIVHKDKSYPGEHEAIVDEALWREVQAILTGNRADRMLGTADKRVSLLSGILFDAHGERMTPTHATRRAPAIAIMSHARCSAGRGSTGPTYSGLKPGSSCHAPHS